MGYLAVVLFLAETAVFSVISMIGSIIDRSGNTFLVLSQIWARVSAMVFGMRMKVEGLENLVPGKHYVYVANHSSYLDILIVISGIPDRMRLVFRSTLTRIPIWGFAMRLSPFIIIERTNPKLAQQSLRDAVESMKTGASVLLFPEGTRSIDGTMQSFKRGAFHLAYESGAEIIPVAIIGAYDMLPRQKRVPNWGRKSVLRIGRPIVPNVVSEAESRSEELRLMKEAEDRVRELLTAPVV